MGADTDVFALVLRLAKAIACHTGLATLPFSRRVGGVFDSFLNGEEMPGVEERTDHSPLSVHTRSSFNPRKDLMDSTCFKLLPGVENQLR